jgi:hypothetical protein
MSASRWRARGPRRNLASMNIASLMHADFPGFIALKSTPKGWRLGRSVVGPEYARRDLIVRVSEHVEDGQHFRGLSIIGRLRIPTPSETDRVVRDFLADGFGTVSVFPARTVPTMLILKRSLDPVDPDLPLELGARMEAEPRADRLIEGALKLRSRVGWLKTVLALYAVVSPAMPRPYDRTNADHLAIKVLSIALERHGREHDKLVVLLPSLARRALADIDAAHAPTDDAPVGHAAVYRASVRALLEFLLGDRERAIDCVRHAAVAHALAAGPVTPAAEGEALVRLGMTVRQMLLSDGDNPWAVDEEALEEESRTPARRPSLALVSANNT